MPSSACSPKKEAPIATIAASASGWLAMANRSSMSSSVTSRWSKTMVRRKAAILSRLGPGGAPNSISRRTPSVGSGANTLSVSPPGPISTSRPARSRVVQREPKRGAAAKRVADEVHLLDAELVQQAGQRVGGDGEEVPGHRPCGGLAIARQVHHQGAELLRRRPACCGRSCSTPTRRVRRRAAARPCRRRPRPVPAAAPAAGPESW